MVNYRPIIQGMDKSLWNCLSLEERSIYQNIRDERRQIEWSEVRRALFEIYDHYGKVEFPINNLSHAWLGNFGMSAAVACYSKNPNLKIGVDIEHIDRVISDTLMGFVSEGMELLLPLENIFLWNIKEACFKAGKNLHQSEDFRNYQVQNFDSFLREGEVQEKRSLFTYKFKLIRYGCWSIAVAVFLD